MPVAVVVGGPGHETPVIQDELPDSGARDQGGSVADCVRHVRHVGTRHRTDRAPDVARAASVAAKSPGAVGAGDQGGIGGPPMPPELFQTSHVGLTRRVKRRRHEGPGCPRGVRRVTIQTGDSDVRIVGVVVRLQFPVVEGPVIGNAVQGLHPEVGRAEPRDMARPVDGASADRIEHQWIDRGIGHIDRVILGQLPDVRVAVERRLAEPFPVRAVLRVR